MIEAGTTFSSSAGKSMGEAGIMTTIIPVGKIVRRAIRGAEQFLRPGSKTGRIFTNSAEAPTWLIKQKKMKATPMRGSRANLPEPEDAKPDVRYPNSGYGLSTV